MKESVLCTVFLTATKADRYKQICNDSDTTCGIWLEMSSSEIMNNSWRSFKLNVYSPFWIYTVFAFLENLAYIKFIEQILCVYMYNG